MRKIGRGIIMLLCLSILVGCGSSKKQPVKPPGLENKLFEISIETLQVIDDYIDNKISREVTKEKMEALFYENYDYFVMLFDESYVYPISDATYEVYGYLDFLMKGFILEEYYEGYYLDDQTILLTRNALAEWLSLEEK